MGKEEWESNLDDLGCYMGGAIQDESLVRVMGMGVEREWDHSQKWV